MSDQMRFEQAASVLPPGLRQAVLSAPLRDRREAEEIRLRIGRAPQITAGGRKTELAGRAVDRQDLMHLLEIATRASAHRALGDIRAGFLSMVGGHRLGFCGAVSMRDGGIMNMSDISSACIRIAREHKGVAQPHLAHLTDMGEPLSVLIIAPPGGGKTTYLRDLVRLLSDGAAGRQISVSLADERGEVAAFCHGEAGLDVGRNTDVLSGCPKGKGVLMLLRSMAPEVIAVDEITAPEDTEAMLAAANCGVRLIATAHALCFDDLEKNELYARLVKKGVFQKLVVITAQRGKRKYEVTDLDKAFGSNTYGGGDHLDGGESSGDA